MANVKKKLRKSAQKFRRTEPAFYNVLSNAIDYMAYFINKSGTPEVTVVVENGTIIEAYANNE